MYVRIALSKVILFPIVREQFTQFVGVVVWDPVKDIGHPFRGIHPRFAATGKERIHHRITCGSLMAPAK